MVYNSLQGLTNELAVQLGNAMRTLRIVALGLLGATVVLAFATIHQWRNEARRKQRKQSANALREMTPESLIANCGPPSSDTEPLVLHMKLDAGVAAKTGVEAVAKQVAVTRLIEYRGAQFPAWVKLEFGRDFDGRSHPTGWHFTHFASPSVGVSSSDENAFLAIDVFPCMVKRAPSHLPESSQRLPDR
jgi:hypothetical protein